MHYYVDGYNFLFRICNRGAPLEMRRESLIDILNRELRFLKGRCSLIFDSAQQIRNCPQCAFLDNLEVVYTPRDMTADAYIIELVDQSRTPKMLTVVTSDTGLARQCRSLGAHVTTIEAFITLIIKKTAIEEEEKPTQELSDRELERLRKIFEERLDS